MKIAPGLPYPLGASWDGHGVNFALYSEEATAVELCLFDSPRSRREKKVPLPAVTGHVHHGYIAGAKPGQLYGYRVRGPYDPVWGGRRFNHHKLLIDPYARALAGGMVWKPQILGYPQHNADEDLAIDRRNDALYIPKGVVLDDRFAWGDDSPPRTPLRDTVIYEAHVKGFTRCHPDVPPPLRGTYAAMHRPPVLGYLKQLGVTAVELLPVHAFVDDGFLLDRSLVNYWGYNTINFFTPEGRYAAAKLPDRQVREFKEMVKGLHAAGIEVILDVVYNHTAEGNHMGPTLSFRGIDNTTYYRLVPGQPRHYVNYTGTGNSLNTRHPQVLKLVMDSLRYWVEEMHVDGFRFDLASTLAREEHAVDRFSGFFDAIHQDPVVSRVKLIAEPWDIGEGGYQVGNFPLLWSEWNDKYRDSVRRYWKGDEGLISDLAYRLSGSSDLYEQGGRGPAASINFITAHDGFTLSDLVSYNEKHNAANGEDNKDGTNENDSWNCGVEGPSDDHEICALRARQQRNFIATLLLSQGVPMIVAGDEIGRTQQGNNNAYCQDNAISWLDWELDEQQQDLLDWTRRLLQFRAEQPVLRRDTFFKGRPVRGSDIKDLAWFRPDGGEMQGDEWQTSFARSITMRLGDEALTELDKHGNRESGGSVILMFNSYHESLDFTLPVRKKGTSWEVVFDSHAPRLKPGSRVLVEGGEPCTMAGRAIAVLRRRMGN